MVFLAMSSQDLMGPGGITTGAYRLPPGAADPFVLAPGQQLFAAALGAGGLVSVSQSEALPLV
jgi:hypothetical protein